MKTAFKFLLGGLALAPFGAAQGVVDVGDTPAFEFQQAPLFGAGLHSLADLRGRPTIIEFWGTR